MSSAYRTCHLRGWNAGMCWKPTNRINEVPTVSTTEPTVALNCSESTFPLCWVGGEISNLTYAASGRRLFFAEGCQAQVRCAWRSRAQMPRLAPGKRPADRNPCPGFVLRTARRVPAQRRSRPASRSGRPVRAIPALRRPTRKEGLFAVDRKRRRYRSSAPRRHRHQPAGSGLARRPEHPAPAGAASAADPASPTPVQWPLPAGCTRGRHRCRGGQDHRR